MTVTRTVAAGPQTFATAVGTVQTGVGTVQEAAATVQFWVTEAPKPRYAAPNPVTTAHVGGHAVATVVGEAPILGATAHMGLRIAALRSGTVQRAGGTPPACPFDAQDLVRQVHVHELTDLHPGQLLQLTSIEHPTGGTPAWAEAYLLCRRPSC